MTALSQAEIHHLQALRAKNIAIRDTPTMPTKVWDNTVGKPDITSVEKPVSSRSWARGGETVETLASRAFAAKLNVSDLRIIALAVLEMQDTICELRERVRVLENDLPPKS